MFTPLFTLVLLMATQTQTNAIDVVQGSPMFLQLDAQDCVGDLTIFDRTYRCTEDYRLIVGVHMSETPGRYYLTRRTGPGMGPVVIIRTVMVRGRNFPFAVFHPPPVPPQTNRPQERADIGHAQQLGESKYFLQHLKPNFSLTFSAKDITSKFGERRMWRSKKGVMEQWDQHNGIDFRASAGTPVSAIGDGVVTMAQTLSLESGLVIIYHGESVYSYYMHLGKINVHVGQSVSVGEDIGLVGGGGFSTGAHFHLGVKINGAVVDPFMFVELMK